MSQTRCVVRYNQKEVAVEKKTNFLGIAWTLFVAVMVWVFVVPVGQASVWMPLPTAILGLPIVARFGGVVVGSFRCPWPGDVR